MKYIKNLTEEEIEHLQRSRKYGSVIERDRAHAILLSYQKVSIAELMRIFDRSRRAIERWLRGWEHEKLDSLVLKKGRGRKSLLNDDEHPKQIKEWIREHPKQKGEIRLLIKQELNIDVSTRTMTRFFKKNRL